MKLFSPDGKLYRAMVKLTDAVKINFMWLLFSLPVVTLGASTIAAFTVAMRFVEDEEGHVAHDFVKAFKANIKQGIPMSFINLLCIWVVYMDFQIMDIAENNSVVYLVIGVIAVYIFTFSLLYTYPLLARYENKLFRTIQNSFRISMRYFLRSVGLVLVVAFEIALFIWNTQTLVLGVFFGPIIVISTISWAANRIFEDVEKKNAE